MIPWQYGIGAELRSADGAGKEKDILRPEEDVLLCRGELVTASLCSVVIILGCVHSDFSLFLPDSVNTVKFSDSEPFLRPALQGRRGGRWSGGLPPPVVSIFQLISLFK